MEKIGRFLYIEPNDIPETKNNTTQPYENYSIDVELEVKIPNRGVWVNNSAQTGRVAVEKTSHNGNIISFFGGNDDNLTTTPGSTIYKDILNGKKDRESLGITNINISYNSYFYPQVVIQFTDIRGMGLMMPHEEVYRQEQTNDAQSKKIEKFFAALFTFPSPEFILRVKGFYGKKVEYSLIVESFHSNFNNQTGNFEVTVKFIGKMYGVYTDIPMSHVLIAPYCKYASDDLKTLWDTYALTFPGTNVRIPTLLEFKKQLLTAEKDLMEYFTSNMNNDMIILNTNEVCLENVMNAYNDFIDFKFDEINDKIIKGDKIILFPHEPDEDTYTYIDSSIKNKINNLFKAVENFNKNNTKDSINYLKPFTKENIFPGSACADYICTFTKSYNNNISVKGDNQLTNFIIDFNQYETLKKLLNEKLNNLEESKYLVVDCNSFHKEINELKDRYTKKHNDYNTLLNESGVTKFSQLIGYDLTIKNIFTILMANLWIYIELLKNCVERINGDDKRTIKDYKLSSTNLPDIPTGISETSNIPPFPALKNESNEFCYFNDIGLDLNKIEENKLIESFFIGQTDAIKQIEESEKLKTLYESQSTIDYFIPTCISDFNTGLNPRNKMNPYSYIFADVDNNNVDWVLFFFTMRWIQKFIMERGTDIDTKEFGKYEAYNLWLAHPQFHLDYNDIFNIITTGEYSDTTKFITHILKNDNCYNIDGNPLLETRTDTAKNNVLSIPILEKYMPASIGYGGGFEKYCNEYEEENNFSYNNGVEIIEGDQVVKRPYGLINEIDENILNDWDTNIKNLSNIPNDITSHETLISKYLNNNNLYYSNKELCESLDSELTIPTWNITYYSNKNLQFFNIFEDLPMVKYGLETLNDTLKNDNNEKFDLFYINSRFMDTNPFLKYHYTNKVPLFLIENLQPEDILLTIPHNIEKINVDILEGCKILTMPYSTKLYLGYLINVFKNNELTDDDFRKKIYDILDRAVNIKPLVNDIVMKIGLSVDGRYKMYGTFKNSGINYLSAIETILLCLTTDKNNKTIAPEKTIHMASFNNYVGRYPSNEVTIDSLIDGLIKLKNDGFFQNDIFGFENEFIKWSQNRDKGGFLYFKDNLSLKMKPETSIINIGNLSYVLTGRTQCERFKNFLLNEEVQNELYKDNSKNIVNDLFTDNSPLFSEIYKSIILSKIPQSNLFLIFDNDNIYVNELDYFLKKTIKLIIPYKLSKHSSSFVSLEGKRQTLFASIGSLSLAYESFKETLKDLYTINTEENKEEYTLSNVGFKLTNEQRLSMYSTLRNLYNKHFTCISNEIDKYRINKVECELNRFYFVDSWNKNIGNLLYLNPKIIIELIDTVCLGYESGKGEGYLMSEMSFYSFMALICQKHNLLFIAVPVFNASLDSEEGKDNLKKMFKPLSYNESHTDKNTIFGPSYICYYPHQPSQFLENPLSQYKNDGFLIKRDLNDTSNFEGPASITDFENGIYYDIPAFGVEYGSQKQSIFKNINVNMDNPQVTEVAVANQFNIANSYSKNIRQLEMLGHDLYKIYSNYSYTCKVDMMGCAQIQPLMYFQLNNIPMFRGAYQIISVEHNITPGDMTTSFKGVRINKTQIPLEKSIISVDMDSLMGKANIISGQSNNKDYNFVIIESDATQNSALNNDDNKSTINANDLIDTGYVQINDDNLKINFNRLNPNLRKLMYCIALDLPSLSEKTGYKLGFRVTSATRDNALTGSYHRRMTSFNSTPFPVNKKRDEYKGLLLSDDGLTVSDELVSYNYMGCAIDIRATKNGEDDRYEPSIILFNHIATKYTNYLKQLIWELNEEKYGPTTEDRVDLIHIASLGMLSKNDKGSIFAGRLNPSKSGGNTKTYTINDSKELSNSYKDICENIDSIYVTVNIGA